MIKRIIFLFCFFITPTFAAAPIILDKAPINPYDQTSIARGAKFFATYCMSCHSLKYLVGDPVAKAAGIDYEKMPIQAQDWWANAPPPDLSLVAAARGPNWLYTYLHSFYQDSSRSSGSNNLLIDNTNMPNPFFGMQGTQKLLLDRKDLLSGNKSVRWFNDLELVKQGSMTPEEFDKNITDLVNFLTYASDPMKRQRETIGWFVLLYLVIFGILVYLLKRLYWKKIK